MHIKNAILLSQLNHITMKFTYTIKRPVIFALGVAFSLLFFQSESQGQRKVSGTITNEKGAALSGVSIRINNTTTGTLSDNNGRYKLNVPDNSNILDVSYLGYKSRAINVNNRTIIDIVLYSKSINLDQLVVTGYSTTMKKDITGSVGIVDMDNLKEIPAESAGQALQGQVSGVQVINSGVPGAASKINIRGITSFGSSAPLVLVDGVPSSLDNIDANNIKSIQVLKDAGSASVYGVRGSNGVIIVTTKKGRKGDLKVTYDGYYGYQFPISNDNPLNVISSEEYAKLYSQVHPNTILFKNGIIPDYAYGSIGGVGIGMEGDPSVNPAKYNLDIKNPANNYLITKLNKQGTDWYHALFNRAPMTHHQITGSGGNDRANYLFSLGYMNKQGTLIATRLKRYSARINTELKVLNDKIRFGENLHLLYKDAPVFNNQGDFYTMFNLYRMLPVLPVYDIKGNFAGTFDGPELGADRNPVAEQKSTDNNRNKRWGILGNAYVEVEPIKNLILRSTLGLNFNSNYVQAFRPITYWNKQGYTNPNSYSESSGYSSEWIWTNTLHYQKQFGENNIKLLLGSESIRDYGRSVGGGIQNLYSSDYNYLILGNGTDNRTNYSNASKSTLYSLFGRVDYSYNDKYLFSATLRRDGASVFGSKRKFGVFPAFSAGWRISQEEFLKDVSWLDNLKIRGSYGILGSKSNISSDGSYSLYGSHIQASYYGVSGTGNAIRQGFYQSTIGNEETGWERDIVTNIGFDAALLNKVTISLDVFRKSIDGLLFAEPLPATVGGASAPIINIGDVKNSGLDLTVGYHTSFNNNLQFNVTANVSSYKNVVVDIPDPGYFGAGNVNSLGGNIVRNQEGHPMSAFFGYKVLGLFNSIDEVKNSPVQDDAAPGRFKYADIDDDGEITPEDRTFIGNPNPNFTYGVNVGLSYKNFDLSAFVYGSQGNDIVNTIKQFTYSFGSYVSAKSKRILDAWTPNNKNTNIPKVEGVSTFSSPGPMNSFYIEDGSYLRLKSLMVGYTFPIKVIKSIGVNNLRLYLQASNLFDITRYSGLDPEIVGNDNASFGIDRGNYPGNQTELIFGCHITL